MLVYLKDPTDIESIQRYRPKNNKAAIEYVNGISDGYIVEIFREQSPWTIRQRRNGVYVDKLKYSLQSTQIYRDKYIRNLNNDTCYLVDSYDFMGRYSNTSLQGYTHSNITVLYPGDKLKYFVDGKDHTFYVYRNELYHKSLNEYTGYIDMEDIPMDTLFNLTLEYPVSMNVDPVLSCDELHYLGIEVHKMYLKKFGNAF